MKHPFNAVIVTASLTFASAAFAQSASAPAPANPATASLRLQCRSASGWRAKLRRKQ
jgi:hypothetical protein